MGIAFINTIIMEKNMIIVGAGIAGLSSGYYARASGYRTSIFEMHSIPGGLCTAWKRKGYKFDISMHMFTGAVSGPFHQMWKELGVADRFTFQPHDHITQIEAMGHKLYFCSDREMLEKQLFAISPEDEGRVRELTGLMFGRDMMKAASLKTTKLLNLSDKIRQFRAVLPLMPVFKKYGKMTLQEFASGFKHPFLRFAIPCMVDSPGWPMPDFPMAAMPGFIRSSLTEAGPPLGGSQQVVFHMADRFKQMGGELHLKSRVEKLLVEEDRVKGIELADGTTHMADHVIWAGDGHTLIFEMLEGKYLSDKITEMYEKWTPVSSLVHVMIGVNRDLSREPHDILFEPTEAISVAGKEFSRLCVLHHCFDPSTAPAGKSAVEVWYPCEYEYWEELYQDQAAYKAEKKRIADYTVEQLDKRWPGFASQVEVIDVPTPATYKRYTGNWKGSPDGWYVNPHNLMDRDPVRTLPGLDGLQMVGQWTTPYSGVVLAALSGRQAIQLTCREEGRPFRVQRLF